MTVRSWLVRMTALLLPCVFWLGSACTEVPVQDVTKSFGIEVREIAKNKGAIKLDFLWVVDNSASMCQEQYALSKSFGVFRNQLDKYLNIDIRLAVTTTDAISNAGKFVNKPAKKFPPGCIEARILPCLKTDDPMDDECYKTFGAGWRCREAGDSAEDIYNFNGSVNSACVYGCDGFGSCCSEFCGELFEPTCAADQSCLEQKCSSEVPECGFSCRLPTQMGASGNGCVREPQTSECPPANSFKWISGNQLEYFSCLATVEPQQDFSSNIEQGLKAAWLALDSEGPNATDVAGFLRDDAYLVIAFVSDEDDCSIDSNFCSPAWTCDSDDDCGGSGKCKLDVGLSYQNEAPTKTCCGMVRKDYYTKCSLLGDYKGEVHHQCAYDLGCRDCLTDEDCDYGWECKIIKDNVDPAKVLSKCRPGIYSLQNIASYQQPVGTPVFALTPVADYYSKFRTLKDDPAKVLVAVITGDAYIEGNDEDALISEGCLERDDLTRCQAYKSAKELATAACLQDVTGAGCEDLAERKRECARECYMASEGFASNYQQATYSYICQSQYGVSDFGSRYVRLADMFGPNGMVSNICSEEGIAPALQTIAELIIKRVTKVCLPMTPKEGQEIMVIRTITKTDPDTGKTTSVTDLLVEGEEGVGDYRIEYPTQDCCSPDDRGNCTGTLKAITFNDVQDPDAVIEVRYEGSIATE